MNAIFNLIKFVFLDKYKFFSNVDIFINKCKEIYLFFIINTLYIMSSIKYINKIKITNISNCNIFNEPRNCLIKIIRCISDKFQFNYIGVQCIFYNKSQRFFCSTLKLRSKKHQIGWALYIWLYVCNCEIG